MSKTMIADPTAPTAPGEPTKQKISRRKILLGGTTLAAASALGSAAPTNTAQAQAPTRDHGGCQAFPLSVAALPFIQRLSQPDHYENFAFHQRAAAPTFRQIGLLLS